MKRVRIYTVKLGDTASAVERLRLMCPDHRVSDDEVERLADGDYEISVVNVEPTIDLVVAHPKSMEMHEVRALVRELYHTPYKMARDSVHVSFPLVLATSKAPMTIFFNVLHNTRLDVEKGQNVRYASRVQNPAPAWRTGVGTVVAVHDDYVTVLPKRATSHKTVPRENLLAVVVNEEKNESWGD